MRKRLRLLPVLVAVAGLALAARVTDLWQGFAVMAQEKPGSQAAARRGEGWGGAPAQGQDETAPEGDAAAAAPGDAPADSAGSADPGAGSDGQYQLPPDPLTMTNEEVDVLQALAERREEIERRARRLEEREVLLQAAERRIEEKVTGLRALRKSIEELLNAHKEQTENQYRSLVKIYENMKPKSAALIFEELDMDVLLPVVERMKERKIAPILAKMNAEKAKAITTQLAQRRAMPEIE